MDNMLEYLRWEIVRKTSCWTILLEQLSWGISEIRNIKIITLKFGKNWIGLEKQYKGRDIEKLF